MIKTILMFALAILGGAVWAEVPQPVYIWDGADGTATEETVFGKTVYTLNDGKVINATETIPNGIPAKNFTFSMWTKKRSNLNWRDVCGFADSSYQFKLEENKDDGGLYVYGSSGAGLYADNNPVCISSEFYSAQELQLLTVVQNNGIVYGYINGVLKMTSLESTTWEALKSDTAKMTYFAWGCAPNTNGTADRPASLSVADVSIYDVALTDAQVMELYYSYLGVEKTTKAVISLNVARYNGSDYNATDLDQKLAGLEAVPGAAWVNLNSEPNGVVVTNLFWSGTESASMTDAYSVSYSSKNTYGWPDATDGFLKTYLDDGEIDGHRAQLTVAGIPFAKYSVIVYCATDEQGKKFSPVTVNGTTYTVNEGGVTVEGDTSFGASRGLVAQYATTTTGNAIKIDNLSGVLTVNGGNGPDGARGGIAAIQIIKTSDGVATVPTMTIGGEGNSEVNWSTVENWADGNVADSGSAKIILQGNATLSIDQAIDLNYISVEGDYTLTVKRTLETGATRISNLVAQKDIVMATGDVEVEYFGCPVIYTRNVSGLRSSISGITYAAGAGSSDAYVGMSLVGGSATLTGSDPFYLVESYSATATDVTFDGAQVVYGGTSSNLSLGTANYVIKGDSNVSAERMVLSQGANGQTSVITVQDESVVNITGNNNVDRNTASIMFGHWNGPSTFNLEGNAAFVANLADVLVGLTRNDHTININGGTFTARGIRTSSYASGTNTLNLNGGVLKLGETGITSYGSTSISVNVGGNATLEATAETLPVSQSVNLAEDAALAVKGYAKFTGSVSGSGSFSVDGEGNILDFGNADMNGFDGSYSVLNGATLILPAGAETGVSVSEGSILKLSLSQEQLAKGYSSKANSPVLFITREGNPVTDNVNGGVYAPYPVWTPVSADSSWSDPVLWSSGSAPTTGDIVIDTSAMTEPISIQVPSAFASVIILGNESITTSVTFDNAPSNISVFGKVKLPASTINDLETLDIKENVTLAVDVAEGEVAITKRISGNFAFVKTGAGTLKLDAEIVPNGGTVIEEGTLKFGTHYLGGGSYNNAGDVRVKSGAVFDYNGKPDAFIRNVTLEEGAVFQNSSDNDIGTGKRQLKGIILEGDATVYANGDFGLVASGHNATKLQLNNHCLTKTGPGNFWLINTTDNNNAGDFRVKEGILCCSTTASTLTGVKLSIEGEAELKLDASLSGLASLKFRSDGSGNGVGFTGLNNLDAAIRPVIDAGLINPEFLNVGETVTLVNGSGLTNNFANVSVGGRFETVSFSETETAVNATVGELKNFYHYDFNGGYEKESAKADDSTYEVNGWGDVDGGDKRINSRNGMAAKLFYSTDANRFCAYWGGNTADNKSPFHAGVGTIVSVIKPRDADKRIVWALGNGNNNAIDCVALAVENDSTLSLVKKDGTELVSVTGIKNLTKTYHFVVAVCTPESTILMVDDLIATSDKVIPGTINASGQLGSTYEANPTGYSRQGAKGCYLDDWTVYDAALKQSELKALRSRLTPRPFYIRVR